MSIKGQQFFFLTFLVEILFVEIIFRFFRFIILVILSDFQCLYLVMYIFQRVIVGIKFMLRKVVVFWVQIIFIQVFVVFLEIYFRYYFFFFVGCDKSFIFQCNFFLFYRSEIIGFVVFVVFEDSRGDIFRFGYVLLCLLSIKCQKCIWYLVKRK